MRTLTLLPLFVLALTVVAQKHPGNRQGIALDDSHLSRVLGSKSSKGGKTIKIKLGGHGHDEEEEMDSSDLPPPTPSMEPVPPPAFAPPPPGVSFGPAAPAPPPPPPVGPPIWSSSALY